MKRTQKAEKETSEASQGEDCALFHVDYSPEAVRSRIRTRAIQLAGNLKLSIYGHLSCKSGKRMKRENRVFFSSEQEAKHHGYRPCGHCMPEAYKKWKNEII